MMKEPCNHKGCTNNASCAPRLNVPAVGWSIEMHQPVRAVMDLPICKDCRDTIKVEDFLQDNLKEVIRILTRGKCPPDFERAWFDFVRLDSKEFLEIRQAKTR